MLCRVCLIAAALVMLHQYHSVHGGSYDYNTPDYIKKALRKKEHPPALIPRDKTKTLGNLTIQEVFNRIKEITRSLNLNAMRNGYKVDYKFRMLNQK